MTIAGNQGQNVYPAPDNYPDSSFPQPVPAPTVDPDDAGTLITVQYSWEWQQVLLAAIDQLRNPATWLGDHDDVITALNRATNLKEMLQVDVGSNAPAPYWDDDTDVSAEAPSELQQWYGFVTDPLAPPGELDFVEDITLWLFTGFVMAGFGPSAALFFKTNAPKFYITVRDTNIVELIRIIVDGQEVGTVTTPGTDSGEIDVPVVADPTVTTGHDIYLVKAG